MIIGHFSLIVEHLFRMPNLAANHPVIVHFAIALLVVGVIFRWLSLTGRAAFVGIGRRDPAASGDSRGGGGGAVGGGCARAGRADSGRDRRSSITRTLGSGRATSS
jgi:hypothetical protein